ncbi:MAG: ELM1/GtrOC1 family putative glycosyltransferase [Kiritimatiellia bacterium]|jgi:mitochondrial fission protein ELM1|nr:ELM1/GtrOC1 family putative glycosyltransferase [Kiritimatiellia bacterium]MDD4442916.1 ELM1/GtrOC1 family putative glycosyltransferase [Kiritimatiellia bacterium]MDX9793061.1 ELM1/GtrOC1 family putative glycosyltransferase [Kiritimatiellia bacterium]
MTKKLLIVTDGKAGHENQSKAFCSALGYGYDCVRASYPTRLHKALSYLIDRLGLVLDFPFTIEKTDGYYAAVVCTGSTAFYPGKIAARRRGIPVAAILFPSGYKKLNFDCILAPVFDRPPAFPNIIPIPVNLTSTSDAFYASATAAFRERHTPARPAVGVIIGGPNAVATLTPDALKRDLDRLFALTEGRERWVTTSRRTPPAVEALIASYPFDYTLLFSRDTFNPIPAFVTLCERLFVTADSTGMISEAVTRGTAAVDVLMTLKGDASKFARFLRNLEQEGAVHLFDGTLGNAARKIDLAPAFERARAMLKLEPPSPPDS